MAKPRQVLADGYMIMQGSEIINHSDSQYDTLRTRVKKTLWYALQTTMVISAGQLKGIPTVVDTAPTKRELKERYMVDVDPYDGVC